MAQASEELNPGRAVFGQDQPADHAPQGVAAVEDAQVLADDDPGLGAEQGDGQLALGPERLGAAEDRRQLRLAEVEPAGNRQEPGGLRRLVEHGAQDDPVVGPDGAGPIGTAGGVLMEGTGPPDVGTGAMDLGIIDGRDPIAVPDSAGSGLDQAASDPT